MKIKNSILSKIGLSSGFAVVLALGVWTPGSVRAGPDLKGYEKSIQMQGIDTVAQAEALKPGDTFAMVCTKCESVSFETVTLEKSHIKHLTSGFKHLCPGCKTYITVVGHYGKSEVTHTCESCGDGSAFCCATAPGTGATQGMEKEKP